MRLLFGLLLLLICSTFSLHAEAQYQGPDVPSGVCDSLQLSLIPVGYFGPPIQHPLPGSIITQRYNTTASQGWCSVNNRQYRSSATECQDQTIRYGHDGMDMHRAGQPPGADDVLSFQPGIVIASFAVGYSTGWGESVVIATRANAFSEEIITHHYHHLHATGKYQTESYWTTRQVFACDSIAKAQVLGKEGGSGGWAAHLHFTIRRWNNFKELKHALQHPRAHLLGTGYVSANTALLRGHLDPEGLLYQSFGDYSGEGGAAATAGSLAELYASPDPSVGGLASAGAGGPGEAFAAISWLRASGIEFGRFDGTFAGEEPLQKGELIRWLKVASGKASLWPSQATFSDVPIKHHLSPYVEGLAHSNELSPIVNPQSTCVNGQHHLCPEKTTNRAEISKLVVLSFFQEEFVAKYDNWFWRSTESLEWSANLFKDVSATAWYASFVTFAIFKQIAYLADYGIETAEFLPEATVTREEGAIWLYRAFAKYKGASPLGACANVTCPGGQYCNYVSETCQEIPSCLPSESTTCPYGGGIKNTTTPVKSSSSSPTPIPVNPPASSVADTATQPSTISNNPITPSGGSVPLTPNVNPASPIVPNTSLPYLGGATTVSSGSGSVGNGGYTGVSSSGSNSPNSPVNNPPTNVCQCQQGVCCDGCNFRNSSYVCSTQQQYRCSNDLGSVQVATLTVNCTGDSELCAGSPQQGGWRDVATCSADQECRGAGAAAACQSLCQPALTLYPTSGTACRTSAGPSGSRSFCLELQPNGSYFFARVCQSGGGATSGLAVDILDHNHLSVGLGLDLLFLDTGCTSWRKLDLDYLLQEAQQTGHNASAGLIAEVSPVSACSVSDCYYETDYITVNAKCQ